MAGGVKKTMLADANIQEKALSTRQFFEAKDSISLPVNNSHLLSIRRPALPIIFVPGILASRLCKPGEAGKRWDPGDTRYSIKQYVGLSPKERFEILAEEKESLRVLNNDIDGVTSHCKDTFGKYPHAVARGWGGVMWGAYGDLLTTLDNWHTPLKFLVDLPVYAFGYNWMLSNSDSGEKLKEYINFVKGRHNAKHTLLVTHSMGGLVARAACQLSKAEESVYGIVHGAQPSLGAPDAYRRMVAGQTGGGLADNIAAAVIGPDGRSITAMLAHSIAGLELLPTAHYHLDPAKTVASAKEKDWLHTFVVHKDGTSRKTASMPGGQDPYAAIYKEDKAYWRLLHKEWLFPSGAGTLPDIAGNISSAQSFHKKLDDQGIPYCHPRTVQLYSEGKHDTFCEVVWCTEEATEEIRYLCYGEYDVESAILEYYTSRTAPGMYSELVLVKQEKDVEAEPGIQEPVALEFLRPDGRIGLHLAQGGLVYRRRLLNQKEYITGEYGRFPRYTSGDGTVPAQSGQGLAPVTENWPADCKTFLNSESAGGKKATFKTPNSTLHQDFYDQQAITATQNALHNLVLSWIEKYGDEAGEPFGCKLECLKAIAP